MAPVIPDPRKTRAFEDEAAFEAWLSRHHASETELWLKFHKKGSGLPTVFYKQAVDVALCWGWIDGIVKTFDERSYLQRFTPRKAKSIWSQINRENVARLEAAGRMTEHGRKHVDAAKSDGRWDKAYAGQATMQLPDDLTRAIAANKKAAATLARLNRPNRYSLAFRIHNTKTPEARAKKIAQFVALLASGVGPLEQAPAQGKAKSVKPRATAPTPAKRKATQRKDK